MKELESYYKVDTNYLLKSAKKAKDFLTEHENLLQQTEDEVRLETSRLWREAMKEVEEEYIKVDLGPDCNWNDVDPFGIRLLLIHYVDKLKRLDDNLRSK